MKLNGKQGKFTLIKGIGFHCDDEYSRKFGTVNVFDVESLMTRVRNETIKEAAKWIEDNVSVIIQNEIHQSIDNNIPVVISSKFRKELE